MANPRPTPKPENFGLPWPLPARRDNPAGYSRGRPVRGLKMIVGWFGIPWGWRRQPMNWRPIRGWTKPLHERGMKADSMPERLLIGPGSPPSIDPVYPELSPPLDLNHAPRVAPCAPETWRPVAIVRKIMETFQSACSESDSCCVSSTIPTPRCGIRHGP